tara:strand:- start:2716 stop:2832 length:117 start_codon:yes stop_codon:yes gene_type:complete
MKIKFVRILFMFIFLISVFGCGKKSELMKYPDSEYSRE